jgi:DNA polymerase III subunit epsilon
MNPEENELYCEQLLRIKNARGEVARKLRELAPVGEEEMLSRPLSAGRFLVVDLETTGGRADRSRILEIGAVEVDGFSLGRELGSLVYPGMAVPSFITRLTGIDTSMAIKAPRLPEVLPLLERMLKGRILVAHNAQFDFGCLEAAWREVFAAPLSVPTLCTVKLSRRAYPDLPSHSLDALAAFLHLHAPAAGAKSRHRALGDARLTAAALVEICWNLERAGMADLHELFKYQRSRRGGLPKKVKVPGGL